MGLTRQEKARREAQIVKETVRDPNVSPHMGMKPVELPGARTLPELFSEMRPVADLTNNRRRPGEYFCSARKAGGYWNVVPSPAVREVLDGMQQGLGIYFEIVMRNTGTALVRAGYDQILGGRWLAVIDGAKVRTALK